MLKNVYYYLRRRWGGYYVNIGDIKEKINRMVKTPEEGGSIYFDKLGFLENTDKASLCIVNKDEYYLRMTIFDIMISYFIHSGEKNFRL